jgi:hypothetical protein
MTPENFRMLLDDLETRVAVLEAHSDGPAGRSDGGCCPGADTAVVASDNYDAAFRRVMELQKFEYVGNIMPGAKLSLDGIYSFEDLEALAHLMRHSYSHSGKFLNE